jgi:hypothetical protein
MLRGGTYLRRNTVKRAIFWLQYQRVLLYKERWVPYLRIATFRGRRGRPSARLGEDGVAKISDFERFFAPSFPRARAVTCEGSTENGQNFTRPYATGERRTARDLLDQLGHHPGYPLIQPRDRCL